MKLATPTKVLSADLATRARRMPPPRREATDDVKPAWSAGRCACGGGCPRCAAKGAEPIEVATVDAGRVARALGASLPSEVQRNAEMRYGHSFAHVRVHADDHAASSAASLHAAAYTVGSDIVFGANRYDPDSAQGRLLLQHELHHVEQQRFATPTGVPMVDSAHSVHEREATHILDPHVERLSIQRIQRAPEDAPFSLGTGPVDKVGNTVFGDSAWPFVKAVFEGFVGGLQTDVKSGRAADAMNHLSKLLWPWNAAKFSGGYLVGLVLGLVSPITDLVKGIIGVAKLAISALEWLAKWSAIGIAISPERQQKIANLIQKFVDLSIEFNKAWTDFISDPVGSAKKFAGFLNSLMQMALGKARELGAKAAHSIFDYLEKDYFEMGKGIGEVIGALVAQILLLVFSDAIGNLISKGASFLGKVAEFVAGKAVEVFEWVKGLVSEFVALLRNAVKGALKLFEGLVNKITEAFDALAAIFTESEALGAGSERVAAGVGRGVAAPPNIMESRMVVPTRKLPTRAAELYPPKVHPSKAASPGELMGPKSTAEAIEDLERTGAGAHPGEAAAIGTEGELMDVQDWAAELAKEGYKTYPRNRFGEARIGDRRLSSIFTDQRSRPDMIAINEAEKTIIVGDVTAQPGTIAKIPGRIGQEERLHIEKTIEYAKQLKRQLPGDSKYRVFAQDRHWQAGTYTKMIEIRD